jgi:adenylylsulfate kinase-like enzyme
LDQKGIYKQAQGSGAAKVPGLQTAYEAPATPDLVVKWEGESPETAAGWVVALLEKKGYIR